MAAEVEGAGVHRQSAGRRLPFARPQPQRAAIHHETALMVVGAGQGQYANACLDEGARAAQNAAQGCLAAVGVERAIAGVEGDGLADVEVGEPMEATPVERESAAVSEV